MSMSSSARKSNQETREGTAAIEVTTSASWQQAVLLFAPAHLHLHFLFYPQTQKDMSGSLQGKLVDGKEFPYLCHCPCGMRDKRVAQAGKRCEWRTDILRPRKCEPKICA